MEESTKLFETGKRVSPNYLPLHTRKEKVTCGVDENPKAGFSSELRETS
jgi:hypothetical protein